RYLLFQADFWISIRNTAIYTFVVVACQTALSMGLALIMDQKIRGKAFFRTALFLPSVTSSVAISLIFMFIFFKNGVLNQGLAVLGLDKLLSLVGLEPPVDWLGDPRTALPAIMIQNIWSTSGFFIVVVPGGLEGHPELARGGGGGGGREPLEAVPPHHAASPPTDDVLRRHHGPHRRFPDVRSGLRDDRRRTAQIDA